MRDWRGLLAALCLLLTMLAAPLRASAASATAASGVGTITGRVTDRDSGAPLVGVYITVGYRGLQRAAITGADGRYMVTDVPAGQPADVFGFHGGGYRYHNSIYDDGMHIVLQPGQTFTFNFSVYQLNDPVGEPLVSNPLLAPLTAAPGQIVTFELTASGGKGGLSDEVIAASPTLGRMALLAPVGGDRFRGTLVVPPGTPAGDYPFAFFAASNDCYDNQTFPMLTLHVTAPQLAARAFSQTGFTIANDAFWTYFNARGGQATFGYPTSQAFMFEGFTTQFFQRQVMQLAPDGSVRLLNLLDPGLLPYRTFNFSTFPDYDAALAAQLPAPGSPGYVAAVQAAIARQAPNSWQGHPVNFAASFAATVSPAQAFPNLPSNDPRVASLLPLIDLEIWGAPTSAPASDPSNHGFIYLRWQRGVMQYDAGCNCTQGVLLADYLKAIITGKNLPADLAAEAAASPLFAQYNPALPRWLSRPAALPGTDFTNAFTPDVPTSSP